MTTPLIFRTLLFLLLFHLPAAAEAPVRVNHAVLVHGIFQSGRAFKSMRKDLEARGITCHVPALKPADAHDGVDLLAAELEDFIENAVPRNEKFVLIGFSMGGLVSRYYLQNLGGAKRCEGFMTLSSPHHGTYTAYLYFGDGAKQMRPGSEFLEQLAESESALGSMTVVSYWTPLDLMILPAHSSRWDRAENVKLFIAAHPLMLHSEEIRHDLNRRISAKPGTF